MEKTKKTVDNVAEKVTETKAAAVKAVKEVKETATKAAKETATKAAKATKAVATKKAAEVKETAAKKTVAAKKEATKKVAEVKSTAKKAVAKKAKVEAVVNFQFAGKSYTTDDLIKIAKDVWKYDLNQDEAEFKTVELYVKPEESLAYYVINGKFSGSFFV